MPVLIVFCHLRWNFVFQRPQHLLTRLAQHYRVLYIEEPQFLGAAEPRFERSNPAANVEVLRPQTPLAAPGFGDDQLRVLQPLLDDYLRENSIDDYIVWFYTPMAFPLLEGLHPRAVIYDCMDELSAFNAAPSQMRQREAALLHAAQLVFTGGPSLYEAKRSVRPDALCLPSAVDAQHYSPQHALADARAVRLADDLQAGAGRPRLGFFGVIDERLDVELLRDVADAEPSWHIVMVGPVVKIDPAALPQRANLHWLGQQSYALLPQLVAAWDVCLMPFALNESTRFISPTKTLEYMAAEKPVVSTPVHDVVAMYGDVVRIAGDARSFVAACRAALDETPHDRAERVRLMLATVSRCSWRNAADTIHRAIEKLLTGDSAPALPRPVPAGVAAASTGLSAPPALRPFADGGGHAVAGEASQIAGIG